MKIKVKTKDIRIHFFLPNILVFNHFSLSIILYFIKKYNILDVKNKSIFIKEMKQWKKRYKGLSLVDIQTSDEEEIVITL